MIECLFHILAQETNGGSVLEEIRPYAFIAGIVLAAYMLMRWSQRRMVQSRDRSNLSVQDRVDQSRKGMEIYSQIGELMSQLADLSRQINGQIDTRIAKLELLIGEADQTIANLKKLSTNDAKEIANSDFNPNQEGIETLRKISEKYHQTNITHPSDTPHSTQDGNNQSKAQNHIETTQNKKPNKKDILLNNQRILQLSQQGMSPIEIARKLNRPIGEIELILALNGKKYQ